MDVVCLIDSRKILGWAFAGGERLTGNFSAEFIYVKEFEAKAFRIALPPQRGDLPVRCLAR
jgi:hypothetical protein